MSTWDKHTLNRITESRRTRQTAKPLANLVNKFVKQEVAPRQKKLSRLGQTWGELLPEELLNHTCLENLYRGTLRVLVDDAPSLFELNQIKEELLDQLREHCPDVAPAQIRFVRGYWYYTSEEGIQIPDFKGVKPKESKNKFNG